MISEGSCDPEDWSNDAENSGLPITWINDIWKHIQIIIFYTFKKRIFYTFSLKINYKIFIQMFCFKMVYAFVIFLFY